MSARLHIERVNPRRTSESDQFVLYPYWFNPILTLLYNLSSIIPNRYFSPPLCDSEYDVVGVFYGCLNFVVVRIVD